MKKIIIALLGCLIIAGTLIPTSSAPAKAQVPFPPNGASPNVFYHSGVVMTDTTSVFLIFWEPTKNVSPSYNNLLGRFFSDVGKSSLYHNNTQYGDYTGHVPHTSVLVQGVLDTAAYPQATPGSTNLSQSAIVNEIERARAAMHWSANDHTIFFMVTERNETTAECGYHAAYTGRDGSHVIYASVPYIASIPNCKSAFTPNGVLQPLPNHDEADMSIVSASHELMEAVTDPFNNGWFSLPPPGSTLQRVEIADKCASTRAQLFGHLNPDGSNVSWNGHPYVVATEWSNLLSRCTLGNDILYSLIINVNSHQVIGVGAASTANGATIVQWPDTAFAPAPEHLWGFVDAGNGNIMIVNYNSGKVLGVQLTKNAQLLQWDNNGTIDHLWKIIPVNQPPGSFKIQNVATGFVVGVAAASQGPGAPIVLWDNTDAPEHLWTLSGHLSVPSSYCPLC